MFIDGQLPTSALAGSIFQIAAKWKEELCYLSRRSDGGAVQISP